MNDKVKIISTGDSASVPKMQELVKSATIPPMQQTIPTTSQNTNSNNGNNQKGK